MKNIYKCKKCKRSFKSYNKNPKYCSLKCKAEYQAPNISYSKAVELYEKGFTQEEVGQRLGVSQKSIYKLFRRNGYKCRIAKKRNQFGENNDSWKGDDATYAALHYRVYSKRGKPNKCEFCKTKKASRFEWANMTGNYTDINDYKSLCATCHRNFDKKRRDRTGEKTINVKRKAK